ncbi:MAG: tetratricopeptide repeat protein [Pseudomonadales bacterium]
MYKMIIIFSALLMMLGCASTASNSSLSSASNVNDPFELTAIADFAYDRGDWLVAAREYQELAQLVPTDAYALTRLGNVRLKQNDFTGAIHAYGKALERNPQAARAHYNLATAHLLIARESLQASLRNLPRNDGGALVISEKLKHFEALVYEPLVEVSSPNKGLITKN